MYRPKHLSSKYNKDIYRLYNGDRIFYSDEVMSTILANTYNNVELIVTKFYSIPFPNSIPNSFLHPMNKLATKWADQRLLHPIYIPPGFLYH